VVQGIVHTCLGDELGGARYAAGKGKCGIGDIYFIHSACIFDRLLPELQTQLLGQTTVLVTSFSTLLSSFLSSFLVSTYLSVGTLAVVLVNLPNPWSDLVPVC